MTQAECVLRFRGMRAMSRTAAIERSWKLKESWPHYVIRDYLFIHTKLGKMLTPTETARFPYILSPLKLARVTAPCELNLELKWARACLSCSSVLACPPWPPLGLCFNEYEHFIFCWEPRCLNFACRRRIFSLKYSDSTWLRSSIFSCKSMSFVIEIFLCQSM